MSQNPDLAHLAHTCATRLATTASVDAVAADPAFQELLDAIRRSDPKFAFEREGRSDAVAAVREALPLMERDLFDAIIEDHACEVAALTQMFSTLAQALARASGG